MASAEKKPASSLTSATIGHAAATPPMASRPARASALGIQRLVWNIRVCSCVRGPAGLLRRPESFFTYYPPKMDRWKGPQHDPLAPTQERGNEQRNLGPRVGLPAVP